MTLLWGWYLSTLTSPLPSLTHQPIIMYVMALKWEAPSASLSHPPDTSPVCDAPLLPLASCPPSLSWNYSHGVLSCWLGLSVPGQTKACLRPVVVFLWPSQSFSLLVQRRWCSTFYQNWPITWQIFVFVCLFSFPVVNIESVHLISFTHYYKSSVLLILPVVSDICTFCMFSQSCSVTFDDLTWQLNSGWLLLREVLAQKLSPIR